MFRRVFFWLSGLFLDSHRIKFERKKFYQFLKVWSQRKDLPLIIFRRFSNPRSSKILAGNFRAWNNLITIYVEQIISEFENDKTKALDGIHKTIIHELYHWRLWQPGEIRMWQKWHYYLLTELVFLRCAICAMFIGILVAIIFIFGNIEMQITFYILAGGYLFLIAGILTSFRQRVINRRLKMHSQEEKEMEEKLVIGLTTNATEKQSELFNCVKECIKFKY